MVNNRVVELPDITPEMLDDYVKMGRPEIELQLAILENMRRVNERGDMRQTILVGRFALLGSEGAVFRDSSLARLNKKNPLPSDMSVDIDDLNDEYKAYWRTFEDTNYEPKIFYKRESRDPRFKGTWLGLMFPRNS